MRAPPEIKRLRYFLVLAESLSFRGAAKALHISQPPLTQQIKLLEEELGVKLFNRDPTGVTLTRAGEALHRSAFHIFNDAERAFSNVQRIARGEEGIVRIGFTDDYLYGPLPASIAALQKSHPKLLLECRLGSTRSLVEDIESGRLEFCFGCPPFPPVPPQLERIYLPKQSIVAVVALEHPLAGSASLRLSELKGDQFVLPVSSDTTGFYSQINQLFLEARFSPRVVQHVSDAAMAVRMVQVAGGVTIVSEHSVPPEIVGTVRIALSDPGAALPQGGLAVSDDVAGISSQLRATISETFPVVV